MKYVFPILFTLFLASSSTFANTITSPEDYKEFLDQNNDEALKRSQEEYTFWSNKLDNAPGQFPYMIKMADAKNKMFQLSGNVSDLVEATRLLETANNRINCTNAAMMRALAKNYITEHRFGESLNALLIAEEIGTDISSTGKMLFDVYMEVGEYEKANYYLDTYCGSLGDFDYLLRRSKWEDHSGDLSQAIYFMQRALKIAEDKKSQPLILWATTNLGDYYGHEGSIRKSYQCYLKALKMNPGDAYAKKGIAWIAYSYEKNTHESERILNSIESYYHSPDFLLLRAEMAEFDENNERSTQLIDTYISTIESDNAYGNLYNKSLVMNYSEIPQFQQKAVDISSFEIRMRPTAQSYSLLAWSYYKMGQIAKAENIIMNHVYNKTYEPEPLMIAAEILPNSGPINNKNLLEDLSDSSYELGPIAKQKIDLIKKSK